MGFFNWLFGKRAGQWIGLPKRPEISAESGIYSFVQETATRGERSNWRKFKNYLREQDKKQIEKLKKDGMSDWEIKRWRQEEGTEAQCNQLKIAWEKCCRKEKELVQKMNHQRRKSKQSSESPEALDSLRSKLKNLVEHEGNLYKQLMDMYNKRQLHNVSIESIESGEQSCEKIDKKASKKSERWSSSKFKNGIRSAGHESNELSVIEERSDEDTEDVDEQSVMDQRKSSKNSSAAPCDHKTWSSRELSALLSTDHGPSNALTTPGREKTLSELLDELEESSVKQITIDKSAQNRSRNAIPAEKRVPGDKLYGLSRLRYEAEKKVKQISNYKFS